LQFPSHKVFSNDVLQNLVEKIKQIYVLLLLHDCKTTTISSNLWMSKGANDIFALIINFLIIDWKLKHVTLGLFEVNETIGQALPKNLAYVKNEASNLNTMIIALKSIVNYELLGLEESY